MHPFVAESLIALTNPAYVSSPSLYASLMSCQTLSHRFQDTLVFTRAAGKHSESKTQRPLEGIKSEVPELHWERPFESAVTGTSFRRPKRLAGATLWYHKVLHAAHEKSTCF